MPLSWCLVGLFVLTHCGTALRKQSSVVISANQSEESCVLYNGAVLELEGFGAVTAPGDYYSGTHGQVLAAGWKPGRISLVCFITHHF